MVGPVAAIQGGKRILFAWNVSLSLKGPLSVRSFHVKVSPSLWLVHEKLGNLRKVDMVREYRPPMHRDLRSGTTKCSTQQDRHSFLFGHIKASVRISIDNYSLLSAAMNLFYCDFRCFFLL